MIQVVSDSRHQGRGVIVCAAGLLLSSAIDDSAQHVIRHTPTNGSTNAAPVSLRTPPPECPLAVPDQADRRDTAGYGAATVDAVDRQPSGLNLVAGQTENPGYRMSKKSNIVSADWEFLQPP